MRKKQRFTDLSPRAKASGVALMAAGVAIVAAAERDIQRRPAKQIKGSKAVWRAVSLNALGALGYFRWGRRKGR